MQGGRSGRARTNGVKDSARTVCTRSGKLNRNQAASMNIQQCSGAQLRRLLPANDSAHDAARERRRAAAAAGREPGASPSPACCCSCWCSSARATVSSPSAQAAAARVRPAPAAAGALHGILGQSAHREGAERGCWRDPCRGLPRWAPSAATDVCRGYPCTNWVPGPLMVAATCVPTSGRQV